MFKLSPEAKARVQECKEWEAERKATYANMTDENLIAAAKFTMSNMTPIRFAPGEPVYDATMWHVILPELMRRVSERETT